MLFRSRQPITLINCGLPQVGGSTTPFLDRRSTVVTVVVDDKRLGNPIVQTMTARIEQQPLRRRRR
jgi:hypothetical protein